jgi:hypothetical protein
VNGHKSAGDDEVDRIILEQELGLERTAQSLRRAVRVIGVLLLIVFAFFYGAFLAPVPVCGYIVIGVGLSLGLVLIASDRRKPQ